MMKKVYLATTALEETWDKDADKIIFLGSQCKLYPKRKDYKSDKYIDLQPLWDSQEKIEDAYEICKSIFEKKLKHITKTYNEMFKINENDLFYNRVLGYWLLDFVQNIYDKYKSLLYVYNLHKNIYSSCTVDDDFIPNDYFGYVSNSIDDKYSFQLYSQLIKILNLKHIAIKYDLKIYSPQISRKNPFKSSVLNKISYLLNVICNNKKIVITAPNFNVIKIIDIIKLLLKSKFSIVFDDMSHNMNVVEKDYKLRHNLNSALPSIDDFDTVLNKMISLNIPKAYLESFIEFNEITKNDKKRDAKIYFTANAHYTNEYLKYKVANSKDSQYLIMQHGGGYGLYKLNIGEYWEVSVADKFYSFGWSNKYKVRYLAPSKFVGKMSKKSKSEKILYITNTLSRYLRYFEGYGFFGNSCEKLYINTRINFLESIDKNINITIRMYPTDAYKLYEKERLLEKKFENIIFDDYSDNFYDVLMSCKLHITDITMTTFLEALARNIPTVCFSPILKDNITQLSQEFVEQLVDANILFFSEKSAAEHINSIFHNINSWWLSKEVQKAREVFCFYFARTSQNWTDEWIKEFNTILENSARN